MDEESLVTNGLKPSKKTRKSNIEKGDSLQAHAISSININNVIFHVSNKYSPLAKSKVSFISSPAKRIASSGDSEEHQGSQKNLPTCQRYVTNMSKIFYRHVKNISPTCQKYFINTSRIYHQHVKNNSMTCQKYFIDMSKTFHQHVKNNSTTCQKYFPNMSKKFHLHVKNILPVCQKYFTKLSKLFHQHVKDILLDCSKLLKILPY